MLTKNHYVIGILLFLVQIVTAQTEINKTKDMEDDFYRLGIVASTNNSSFYQSGNTDPLQSEGLFGYSAGIAGTINITNQIEFQPHIMFSRHRAKYKQLIAGTAYLNSEYTFDYFETPLVFNYQWQVGEYAPFVSAGAVLKWLVSLEKSFTLFGTEIHDIEPPERFIKFADFNYALLAGAGCKYMLQEGYLFVQLLFELGLSEVFDSVYNEAHNINFNLPRARAGLQAGAQTYISRIFTGQETANVFILNVGYIF